MVKRHYMMPKSGYHSTECLCNDDKNAYANSLILDDSAFFHSVSGFGKLHHASQSGWYVHEWQTLDRVKVLATSTWY